MLNQGLTCTCRFGLCSEVTASFLHWLLRHTTGAGIMISRVPDMKCLFPLPWGRICHLSEALLPIHDVLHHELQQLLHFPPSVAPVI